MKKILILSYHFPPMNVIASYRAQAYIDHFYENRIFPTIVTHYWDDQPHQNVSINKFDTHQEIRIPIKHTRKGNIIRKLEKFKWTNKISILFSLISGHLDITSQNMDSYMCYKKFLFKHLQNEKYDLILGIFSPHHHIKLSHQLNKKFNINYIIDFRDLWDVELTKTNYSPSFLSTFYNVFYSRYWSKWLKKASFFTTISQPYVSKINELTKINGYKITNGYDENLFQSTIKKDYEKFTISHIGTFYKKQDLSLFFSAFNNFIKENNIQDCLLNFVGVKNAFMKTELDKYIHKHNISNFVQCQGRVSREEALSYTLNSNILYYPSWTEYSGIYSGKIFEYIGSGSTILVAPSDNDVVEEIVHETNTGVALSEISKIEKFLWKEYRHWKENRFSSKNNHQNISLYTRKAQVAKLSQIINS